MNITTLRNRRHLQDSDPADSWEGLSSDYLGLVMTTAHKSDPEIVL